MVYSAQKAEHLLPIIESQPVIPVLKIERVEDAVPLARALARGGLPAIEITLRTPAAVEAIHMAARNVPEAIIGAGTVLNHHQFRQATDAGARFVVSPGLSRGLVDAAAASPIPLLPGAVTPGEIIAAADAEYFVLKFFPAEQAGGIPFLNSLASPFAGIRFCPTGGVSAKNAKDYLSLKNVVCVGGSWVAPDNLVAAGKWDEIEELAREASNLKRG